MVSVLPIRGCVITDLILDGTPIFYHDEETTEDMEKSLR